MSERENPPAGRTRGRKAGVVPEIDLSPSQVREIADPGAAPATAENPAPPRAEGSENAPEQPQAQNDAPGTTPAPAARSGKLGPLVLALLAGLVGGGLGTALIFAAHPSFGIEAGRETVNARLTAFDTALAAAKVREDGLKAEIAALGARSAGAGGKVDLAALEARTTALEQWADALGKRIEKLESEAQSAPRAAGALQPRLESLENAIAALNARLGKGEGQDRLALANGRIAAQGLLEEAFSTALPYADLLDLLARTGASSDQISLIRPFAEAGAPAPKTLREEFLALKAKPAAATTELGTLERLGRALRGLVQIRQLGEASDKDEKGDEAALNRVDRALGRGDLANALAASAELSPAAAAAYAPWRARLEARIRAGEAVAQMRRQAQAALAKAASQK